MATGAGALEFEFDVSWSATNIMLTDGGTPYVTAPLPAGQYTIDEVNVPAGWALDSVSCVNTVSYTHLDVYKRQVFTPSG